MKRPAIDTKPRKLPRQARAKATVDAVITAAASVLVAEGYERTTTSRVAERAGVSVGSLYQYFPNKEALVAALIERHANEVVAVMRRALAEAATASLDDALLAIIRAGADAHRIDPALHKILHEQVPRVGKIKKAMNTSRQLVQALEQLLRARADELHPDRDPALAAIVIETAVEALAHKAVHERGPLFGAGVLEREAHALIAAYVARPRPAHRP
ncbi:Transcriptional regulator, TetR family protein [Minicystis rosea]|nr:Transcriptional regulator, TetR family protein [Minicystis rosea]